MPKEARFRLCVILDIARFQAKNKNYGNAILFHHIFLEGFLSAIINHKFPNIDIDDRRQWENNKAAIINDKWGTIQPPSTKKWEEINAPSIPVKMQIALSLKLLDEAQLLLASFMTVNAFYIGIKNGNQNFALDTLRNKFAHEGKWIDEDAYQNFEKIFANWYVHFKLNDGLLFEAINTEISKLLQ